MRISRLGTGSLAAALLLANAVAGITAAPAWAGPARPLWVGKAATVSGGGTNCGQPGYNTIQAALNGAAAGQLILVCAGTYREQLQITKSVVVSAVGTVVVQLPATPAVATTTCDTQINQGDEDGISICGDVTVSLTGVTVDAAWAPDTCNDSLYGILVAGGATLRFDDSRIVAAGAVPLNGCQGGVGIEAGDSTSTPSQVGHLVLTDSTVQGYQKNGITIDGAGSTADITGAKVTGVGPTTQIAQNGIQVSDGAAARILGSSVSGDECDYPTVCGPDGLTQTQSAGVLIYATDAPVTVTGSSIDSSDIGLYYLADTAKTAPAEPTAVMFADRFHGDRYEAVQLDQGSALLQACTMTDGNVGLQAIQYAGQTFGVHSVATLVTIRHMSVATVQVLSDRAATDQPGTLRVTSSRISSGPVLDNSSNLQLVEQGDF